jgi:hypothetical protein
LLVKEDVLVGNVRRRTLVYAAIAGTLGTLGAGTAALGQAETPASCTASQLGGVIVFRDAAAGNRYARLVVTNQGDGCTLRGFPGLQLMAADGRLLATRVDPTGPEDGASPVAVPHLASVASELHWVIGPCFTGGDDGTPESRPVSVTVSPPGENNGIEVLWNFGPVCGEPDGPSEIDASAFAAL